MLGQRDFRTATAFVNDLASRLANRVQITTDGHRPYLEAIENAFGTEVDYSIIAEDLWCASRERDALFSRTLYRR